MFISLGLDYRACLLNDIHVSTKRFWIHYKDTNTLYASERLRKCVCVSENEQLNKRLTWNDRPKWKETVGDRMLFFFFSFFDDFVVVLLFFVQVSVDLSRELRTVRRTRSSAKRRGGQGRSFAPNTDCSVGTASVCFADHISMTRGDEVYTPSQQEKKRLHFCSTNRTKLNKNWTNDTFRTSSKASPRFFKGRRPDLDWLFVFGKLNKPPMSSIEDHPEQSTWSKLSVHSENIQLFNSRILRVWTPKQFSGLLYPDPSGL